jgi:hypothetical protein
MMGRATGRGAIEARAFFIALNVDGQVEHHRQGIDTGNARRYCGPKDPAFPGVDRQQHGCEGAGALDARRCLGTLALSLH